MNFCVCEPQEAHVAVGCGPPLECHIYRIVQVALWGILTMYSSVVVSIDVGTERYKSRRPRRFSGLRIAGIVHFSVFLCSLLRFMRYLVLIIYPNPEYWLIVFLNVLYSLPMLLLFLSFTVILFFWCAVLDFHTGSVLFPNLLGRYRMTFFFFNGTCFISWGIATIAASLRDDSLWVFAIIAVAVQIFFSYLVLILLGVYGRKVFIQLDKMRPTSNSTMHNTTVRISKLTFSSCFVMGLFGTILLGNLVWRLYENTGSTVLIRHYMYRAGELILAITLLLNIDFDRFKHMRKRVVSCACCRFSLLRSWSQSSTSSSSSASGCVAKRATMSYFSLSSGLVEMEDQDIGGRATPLSSPIAEVGVGVGLIEDELKHDIPLLADQGDV